MISKNDETGLVLFDGVWNGTNCKGSTRLFKLTALLYNLE